MQKGVSMRCYKEGMGWECSSVVEQELTLAQDHGFGPQRQQQNTEGRKQFSGNGE
jgi:hypothetical protein